MELNEIKKLLYKYKPIAKLMGRNKTDRLYMTQIYSGNKIDYYYFIVPESEIAEAKKIFDKSGDPVFSDEMPAQLLIRYLTEPVNYEPKPFEHQPFNLP